MNEENAILIMNGHISINGTQIHNVKDIYITDCNDEDGKSISVRIEFLSTEGESNE